MRGIKFKILLAILSFGYFSYGQEISVNIKADSTSFVIGQQVEAILQVKAPVDSLVEWPLLTENIGTLELVHKSPLDTIIKGSSKELIQKLTITQFDTGKFTISPLRFKIGDKLMFTKSVDFEVVGVEVDTTKQKLYDIKANIAVPYTFMEILKEFIIPYGSILFVILVIAYAVYRYYLNKKNRENPVEEILISPFEAAMNSLKSLDESEFLKDGNIKEYYDSLTDILRKFLQDEHRIAAMESTSDEIIKMLVDGKFPKEVRMQIQELLFESDFVKFAKYKPEENKHEYYRKLTENLIVATKIEEQAKSEEDGK